MRNSFIRAFAHNGANDAHLIVPHALLQQKTRLGRPGTHTGTLSAPILIGENDRIRYIKQKGKHKEHPGQNYMAQKDLLAACTCIVPFSRSCKAVQGSENGSRNTEVIQHKILFLLCLEQVSDFQHHACIYQEQTNGVDHKNAVKRIGPEVFIGILCRQLGYEGHHHTRTPDPEQVIPSE